jgi:competence protein ComEC
MTGLAFAAVPERFDGFVDREGAGAMIRGTDGRLVLVGKPSGFVIEQWLRADGDPRSPNDRSLRAGARCDAAGCTVETRQRLFVAFDQDLSALEEDCRLAAVIVTRLRAPPGCRAALVIDKEALGQGGATALRFLDGSVEVRTSRGTGRELAWSGLRPKPREAAPEPARVPARPVPEQDIPEEEISSGEPD